MTDSNVSLWLGVFAYNPGTVGGANALTFVNCSLSLEFQPGLPFPVQLQLILTGIGLVAIDVSVSLLLCVIKKLSCGVLAILWFLVGVVCMTTWAVWGVVYAVLVFPLWEADRQSCDGLVMISHLVGTGLVVFFCVLHWIVVMVTMVYECWYRCDLECVCSCQRRKSDFDDY